jgi:hypothetical protein
MGGPAFRVYGDQPAERRAVHDRQIRPGYPDLSRFQAGAAWSVPSLILVEGTTLGTEPSAAGLPLEQDFDAVLNLGGPFCSLDDSSTEVRL